MANQSAPSIVNQPLPMKMEIEFCFPEKVYRRWQFENQYPSREEFHDHLTGCRTCQMAIFLLRGGRGKNGKTVIIK
ncbi:hypothetical protein C4569_02120 [Candidatus Parcubacteria bacterium]|nr:MAG: hypothetical protein C4569_02120 [Candidatus Parcubacteria bacterium]